MTIQNAFDGFYDFKIDTIRKPDGSDKPIPQGGTIFFEYANPAISVDSGNRYKKYNIIGGPVVRQRTGQEPKEIDVSGVCIQKTARDIDLLRNTETVRLTSGRFENNTVTVQVVSVSTSPMEDGGSVAITSEFDGKPGDDVLYTYSISCVEVQN